MSAIQTFEAEIRALMVKWGFVAAKDAHEAIGNVAKDLRTGAGNLEDEGTATVAQALTQASNTLAAKNPSATGGVQKPIPPSQ